MTGPALLAVAHGSANPAAADTVSALAREITRLAPVLDVRVAFVQHASPSLADALRAVRAGAPAAAGATRAPVQQASMQQASPTQASPTQAGRSVAAAADPARAVVVVPLLLGNGYHVSADLARAAAAAGAPLAEPLGPDQLLVTALATRLAEAGVPAGTPVVLAAAGSTDPQAAADVASQAELLAARLAAPVLAAFASAGQPTVPDAVAELSARTGRPVAVAAYLLAPGHFHDRLRRSAARWVTAPLGSHPAVAALVIDRYRAALRAA
jgi:sirohydrochlorin ferrochelatase